MPNRIDEILKNKETRAQFDSAKNLGKDVKLENVKPGEKIDHKLGTTGSNANANSSNSREVIRNNQPANTPGAKPQSVAKDGLKQHTPGKPPSTPTVPKSSPGRKR